MVDLNHLKVFIEMYVYAKAKADENKEAFFDLHLPRMKNEIKYTSNY